MSIYPNEAWPVDAVVEALDGTTDLNTGLPYIAKGTGPTSVPSLEVQYNRRLQRLNTILAPWRQGMVVDEGDLRIGVYPIEFTLGGERLCFVGATGVAVADNTSCVVYVDSDCNLQVDADWPTNVTSYLPLATVTSVNGQLLIVDRRPLASFHIPSLEASAVRDRRIVSAHCASMGASESDVEVFRWQSPETLVVEQVQVYGRAVSGSVSVDVKENGSSILAAAAVVVAGTVVVPTVNDPNLTSSNNMTVHVTTGSTSSVTDLAVTVVLKAPLCA